MIQTHRTFLGWVAFGTKWSFVALLASVAVLNAQPYMEISQSLMAEVATVPIVDLLYSVPLLGELIKLTGVVLPSLLGVLVWAILQLMQCIPLFLNDPEMLRRQLIAAQRWSSTHNIKGGSDWVTTLVQRLANFPKMLQDRLIMVATVAYLVDLLIGVLKFPPLTVPVASVAEGFDYLWAMFAGTFDFALLDWGNIIKLAIMLFAFEGFIAIALFIRQLGMMLIGGTDGPRK